MMDRIQPKRKPKRRALALYYISQLTWGLILNIAGGIRFLTCLKCPHFLYRGAVVTRWKRHHSMGIGLFIFLGETDIKRRSPAAEILTPADRAVLVHEYGHTVQAAYLGPLFTVLVGLPSVTWAFLPLFTARRRRKHVSYYAVFPENWANRLGNRVTGEAAPWW